MKKFTNPLDKIKIASPCAANWNEMLGDERCRHCAECKLNVYNLSEMTREEAENFLINAEGRVCLRIYRRADGTVITEDCPVGLAKFRKKLSRAATGIFTLFATFCGGVFALESLKSLRALTHYDEVPEVFFKSKNKKANFAIYGAMSNLPEIKINILKRRR